jgi:peptide/nickel transport system permease protein
MSDYNEKKHPTQPSEERYFSEEMTLDDEQRVKVLSPAMLVFRRFIRNRLAIVGVIFITLMFLFSFVGGWLMPYGESEVFKTYKHMSKLYAGVTINDEFRFVEIKEGLLSSVARAQFVLAYNNNENTFETQGQFYQLSVLGDNLCVISNLEETARAIGLKGVYDVTPAEGKTLSDSFVDAFQQAIKNDAGTFVLDDVEYTVMLDKKIYYAYISNPLAIATYHVIDLAGQKEMIPFSVRLEAEKAMTQPGSHSFTVDGQDYEVEVQDGIGDIYKIDQDARILYAVLSRYVVQPLYGDVFLSIDFKEKIKEAIENNQKTLLYTPQTNGQALTEEYTIERTTREWIIRAEDETMVINTYEYPTLEHPLGTDGNGMDILTRLMYGGRISLMIGFIVVGIAVIIGVILGGIAGYFGKWLDNLLMRLVDIFNCIPSIPIIIIIGAVMDGERVDPQIRMIYLMLILGVLSWPSIARMVRGQILSLREQEFMLAAEATGLSVSRRIMRHLVPNVIPQLIVIATMSLGGIILTESVLSFLGLGVKYPFASWGNIINAVNNVHVMTHYWFAWIPAGFCILITVLGFNFIGDGLRDAFDPKMKR